MPLSGKIDEEESPIDSGGRTSSFPSNSAQDKFARVNIFSKQDK